MAMARFLGLTANQLAEVASKLEAENAKLRELATAQCECVKHDDCIECVHYSEGKCTFPFKVMYRELGLEVDGWAGRCTKQPRG